MRADDLAWVQGQLRGCKCIAKQLKICAEVTGSSEGVLLYELGYEDLHALQRAYPEKQIWYRGKKNITAIRPYRQRPAPVDEATMEKAVRLYLAGGSAQEVGRLMGYNQVPVDHTLSHRVGAWRKQHPALAAQLPDRRKWTKKEDTHE